MPASAAQVALWPQRQGTIIIIIITTFIVRLLQTASKNVGASQNRLKIAY